MRVACVGWGSLIWDPRELPVRRGWFEDGPLLPIEFARISSDGRVTLVITRGAAPVRALWALMDVGTVAEARQALGRRERIPEPDVPTDVGFLGPDGGSERPETARIRRWAERLELDAVIWTALPPGFEESRGEVPDVEALLRHLRGLGSGALENAERYVRRAPPQVDTAYRRRFESELGWEPV